MNIFVTTCSKNKIEGGKPYSFYAWRNERKKPLISVRAQVLDMMFNGELPSGLRLPVHGPDFGGRDEKGPYLEARKRYSEGSFIAGLKASKKNLSEWRRTNRIYFVSALYGLASCNEPIQNYDLRLQPSLQSLWINQGRLANVLLQDLRDMKQICNVIDFCADENYSSLIDWKELTDAGYEVRHAVRSGELEDGQVRWAAGHLAGDRTERLLDLIQHEECRYTSDNGSISLLKYLVAGRPTFAPIQHNNIGISPYTLPRPTLAVAIHREPQKRSFMAYAKNRNWQDIVNIEFIDDLRKETLHRLDKYGVRTLIIHIDDTHANLQKAYRARSVNLIGDLPESWEHRKIKNERYSDIELERRIGFKR